MGISFETIINTIFYIGAIQGVILTIFLFNVKSNKLSNRLLGILTMLWAIILLVFALQSQGLYRHYPHLLRTFFHLLFAWFPLLYLSVKYLVSNYPKFQKLDFFHFTPLVFNVLMFSGFYFKSAAEKLEISRSDSGYYYIADIIGEEILSIQGVVYTILSLLMISNYKRNIVDYHSTIDTKVLNGFRNGIIMALLAWVIGIVGSHVERQDIDLGVDLFLIVYLTFVAIIYLLSILAIRSPEVFKLKESEVKLFGTKKESIDVEPGSIKETIDQKTSDDGQIRRETEEGRALHKQLLDFMEMEKPFLDPELSLQDLSKKLGVSRHNLSAVINQQQKVNFYEFVNIYRINEVKELMSDPKNREEKNYDLAYNAGFNSKASFYRIFKQFIGQTPSEFRAEV